MSAMVTVLFFVRFFLVGPSIHQIVLNTMSLKWFKGLSSNLVNILMHSRINRFVVWWFDLFGHNLRKN